MEATDAWKMNLVSATCVAAIINLPNACQVTINITSGSLISSNLKLALFL